MAVTTIPVSNLDSESDLFDWLANELVTNHRFVEKTRRGLVVDNDIVIVLERPQAETFHNETPLTFMLQKGTNSESTINRSMTFNMSPSLFTECFELVAEDAAVVINWDGTNNRIELDATSSFTNWTTAGYSNGDLLRIANAANSANDGYFQISSISNGPLSSLDRITINTSPTFNNVNNTVTGNDIDDTVTASGEPNATFTTLPQETSNPLWNVDARSNDFLFNWGVAPVASLAPWVSGTLITSPTSDQATPEEPLQFIVILETQTGFYRQFGWGELVKVIPAVEGAWWASGSVWNEGSDIDVASHNHFVQGPWSTTWSSNFNSNNAAPSFWIPNFALSSGGDGQEYGWGWHNCPAYGSASFDAPTQFCAAITPHIAGTGKHLIGFSPSAFSGQSERWPLTVYGGFGDRAYSTNTSGECAVVGVIPDIFIADITNVDAGTTFQDQFGEKFLVVPFYTKTGSGINSSEKWGYLIRNEDLVVT